jgi:hypothetical protein
MASPSIRQPSCRAADPDSTCLTGGKSRCRTGMLRHCSNRPKNALESAAASQMGVIRITDPQTEACDSPLSSVEENGEWPERH